MAAMRLLAVALGGLFLLGSLPGSHAGTGVGVGTHTFLDPDGSSCSGEGRFVVSAEVGVGGAITGDSFPCLFHPDRYGPNDCHLIPAGVSCAWGQGALQSSLTVFNSGEFTYQFLFPDGAVDMVDGQLLI